jgi:hypothetical protein
MITFNVVKEQHGWAIQVSDRMSAHFRTRDMAVREANQMADAIRRHGEQTEVIAECVFSDEPREELSASRLSRVDAVPRWGRPRSPH